MDFKGYLRRVSPLALQWAEQNGFEDYQLIDLATIIKLAQENGKEIPLSQVKKLEKIGAGSFRYGSTVKAIYEHEVFVLKCTEQVI
jgi:hypothetical protein